MFFLDSDDWLEKKAIEKLVLKSNITNADIVIFPFFSYDEDKNIIVDNAWGSKLNFRKELYNKIFSYNDLTSKELISDKSLVVAWNKLYNRNFLLKNKLKFPENLRYEDNPFYYESIIKAKKIAVLNEKILYYRVNRNNSLQSSDYDNKNINDIVPIMKKINNIFIENKIESKYYNSFLEYQESEFLWRFELMNRNCENFLKEIKKYNSEEIFKSFLKRINYKTDVKKYSKNKNPDITVIIPVYNTDKYIEECILSIINQTIKNIEIIFIDDCSTDNSNKIIINYALFDKRIKLLHNTVNKGPGYSRNKGLDSAHGEFVIFMDPDDMYYKDNVLETLLMAVKENKVSIACGNIGVIDSNYRNSNQILTYNGFNVKENRIYDFKEYNIWPSWGFTRCIFNIKLINDNNIKFPEIYNYEDPIFFTKAMIKAKKFVGVPEIVYLYRYIPKKRKVCFKNIEETLDSTDSLLNVFKTNELEINYKFEYEHLVNYCFETVIDYIREKQEKYDILFDKVNNILLNIDENMLKSTNYPIYKNIKEMKISWKSKIKKIIRKIIRYE